MSPLHQAGVKGTITTEHGGQCRNLTVHDTHHRLTPTAPRGTLPPPPTTGHSTPQLAQKTGG